MDAKPFVLGHRPALDGLRGVSVLLVMASHLDLPWFSMKGGFIGVQFFFVLSGFLISSLLFEEWRTTSSVSLTAFYSRRALRLLPALFLLLIVVTSVTALVGSSEEFREVRKAVLIMVLYVTNWFSITNSFPATPLLGHGWSLAVEEQFYMIWPLLLVVLLRATIPKRLLTLIGLAIAASVVWRGYLFLSRYDLSRIYFGSDTNSDGLLIGTFVAILMSVRRYPTERRALRLLHLGGIVVVLLIPAMLLTLIDYGRCAWYLYVGGISLIKAAVGLLIMALLLTPLGTLFEARWLTWIGKISYGLYLWHHPIYAWMRQLLGTGPAAEFIAVGTSFLVATISFYVLERPLLKLKDRIHKTAPALANGL